MTALSVDDLSVSYDKPILWDVHLQVPSGKMAAIIGPNGAGKSTLIKAILGVQKSQSGSVLFLISLLVK